MTISSFTAAKTLCHLSDWTLSHLRLQKILYIAHMVSLGRESQPLVNETFEAWMYGPVLPTLYDRVKVFGADSVRDRFYRETILKEEEKDFKVLKEIWDFLREKKGWELVRITHSPIGAWYKNYNPDGNVTIPNDDIIEEYNKRLAR